MDVISHSTAQIPPARRAAHWNCVIAETYFPLQLTFREPAGFVGQVSRRQLGDVSLSRLATEPLQYERRPNHIGGAQEEEYLITIPRRSPVQFYQIGRDVRCSPGGFILERGDEPYRFSYGAVNELNVLKVPKWALAEKIRDPDRFCAQVVDARDGVAALFAGLMAQLQELALAEPHAGAVLGRQIVEILSLALDGRRDTDETSRSAVAAAHLRRAEHVVRRNLSDSRLDPQMVADACNISKRYLHELFGQTDRTVSQFIRDERLIAARDAIVSSRAITIAEIAYKYGFSDQAHFSRLFKAAFGRTPSEWRRDGPREAGRRPAD